jgi:hypothetical protein
MQRIQGQRRLTDEPSGRGPLPDIGGAATKNTQRRDAQKAARALPLVPILKGDRIRTSGDPVADNAPA